MTARTADRSRKPALEGHKRGLPGTNVIGVAVLVVMYLCLALVLPISTEAPIVDEPIYAESAFEWARSGAIEISGLSAPNAVFDTIWGGLFARVFGETYGALRLSTLVLTALSAPFMYWLCRNLGASRAVSLLATAAYLFNPLVIVLSATFMTDAHFMALVVMSVACFAHALEFTRGGGRGALLAGSVFASLAFLSRPQALVIPVAAALVLLFRSKYRRDAIDLLAIGGLPTAIVVAHALWTARVGEPFIRGLSAQFFSERVIADAAPFAGRLLLMASVYIGLIALPLLPLLGARQAVWLPRRRFPIMALAFGLATLYLAMLLTGYDPTARQGWMTSHGLGAVDRSHLGARPELWPGWVQAALGLLCIISTYVWTVDAAESPAKRLQRPRNFVLFVAAAIVASSVVAAMTFHGEIFDRYWLPLVPLILAVAACRAGLSVRRVAISTILLAVIGSFGILGTRDALVAYEEGVKFAEDSVQVLGLSPLQFDGGAAWSAMNFGVADDGPEHILERHGPFWVKFYAVETRPEYGVALEPLDGYEVLGSREFPSILHLAPTRVVLIRGNPDIGYFIDADDF